MIVPMEPYHLEEVVEIELESFSDPWTMQTIKTEMKNPASTLYVALINDKVVGVLIMGRMFSQGYINNIVVDKNHRNMGIATQLMEVAVHFGYEHQLETMTLEVRKSNIPAQSLYRKFHFQIEGERPGFYIRPLESALVMVRHF